MRKVTVKIIISGFIIMMISSIFPRVIWGIYHNFEPGLEMNEGFILIVGFTSVFISILLFSLFMNRVILKRIKDLNNATRQVMDGNYDFTLEMRQKDEISELTNNFNRMVKELQSNEYLNKEFIRNVSHELKTPLSAINGYAELINTSTLSPEEIKKYSAIIASESKRLSLLAKDILQISLIESQSIIYHGEKFNISEQVRNVIQLMQLEWEQKNIEFKLDLEKVYSTSNKEITYQIWTNLISNAIKFSKNGSQITITLENKDNQIIFTISNPGTISTENQQKVFNLFYVADSLKGRDSNGVGLTLTYKIIEKLSGTISLTSVDDYVTFIVTIPIQ
jgi:signal transduction histidine kinase